MPQHEAFDQARTALRRASEALELTQSASSFEKYDDYWESFLTNLTEVYNKMANAKSHSSGIAEAVKEIFSVRESDPLLSYLKAARDARTHGLAKVVKEAPGGIFTNFPTGIISGRIDYIGYDAEGKYIVKTDIEGIDVKKRDFWASMISAEDTRGKSVKIYHPPSEHLGKMIYTIDPYDIGKMAVTWYNEKIDILNNML